jgi:hypothetical protein
MTIVRLKRPQTVGIGISPDRAGPFFEQMVAKKIRMQRRAAGSLMQQKIISWQNIGSIAETHTLWYILDRTIVIKHSLVPGIDKGLGAELFKKAQGAFHPQHGNAGTFCHCAL